MGCGRSPARRTALRAVGAAFLPCVLAVPALADAVWGEIRPLRQPDGTRVHVRIWGDEYYQVVESLDGYTLVRDPQTRDICYARLSPDGRELKSSGIRLGRPILPEHGLARGLRIHPESARARAAATRAALAPAADAGAALSGGSSPTGSSPLAISSGEVKGICLIIDFSDDVGTIPPSSVVNYCNQVGYTGYGNNGSVRDYFYAVSDGELTYTNYVPPAYYRAAHPKDYYTDSSISYGTRARELILEALSALNASGFDFSQYDVDRNGVVDALNCFYAGNSESAWSVGLWPHASSLTYYADGVRTGRYQITDMQSSLRLATFCHENGHMLLGWPDLYDYGYESRGVGRFCIMCYSASSTNPQEPCAYMKFIAGWANTTVLTTPQTGLPVPASSGNTVYKFNHPTKSNEYYLLENRQKTGRDASIPDAGLAIWHIDTNGSNNNETMTPTSHYKVTLVQADGKWDLEKNRNYGDSLDLWSAPDKVRCDPYTTPGTKWWDGSSSFFGIGDISASAATMTFSFSLVEDCNANHVADGVDISSGTSQDCDGNGIPDECETDSDGDGIIDSCDPDRDNDGVPDVTDNCPAIRNVDQADEDHDGVGTACDACAGTAAGTPVNPEGCPAVWLRADMDRDGDVDQEDFGRFQLCLSLGSVPSSPDWCERADMNDNGSIDDVDFNLFQRCWSGANRVADTSCQN